MSTRTKNRLTSERANPQRRSARSQQPRQTSATRSAAKAYTALPVLLGDLSDAISLVTVVHRSLAGHEASGVGDDEVALRHALSQLRAAYTGLDLACCPSRRRASSSKRRTAHQPPST